MKPPEHLKPQAARFNLTPMIDVVFLLIIFFIVSNNMIQQDHAVQIDLPEATTGTLPHEQQPRRLTISVPKPGTLFVGTEIIPSEAIGQLMGQCRKDWGEAAEICIRTNKDIPYGEVKPLLQMAAENGIIHITFAVVSHSP